jgi:hypothetical protein
MTSAITTLQNMAVTVFVPLWQINGNDIAISAQLG